MRLLLSEWDEKHVDEKKPDAPDKDSADSRLAKQRLRVTHIGASLYSRSPDYNAVRLAFFFPATGP